MFSHIWSALSTLLSSRL